jgi:hypothetical protein
MDFQQTNILSMTGNSDFATTGELANYVDLTSAQTITTGLKTFNTLPQSAVAPTLANQLVNKNYVDGLGAGYVNLTGAQTITGVKTFNANVKLNNTRQLIFGTSSPANINYTLPNLYYDITGGGHYFFIGGSPNLYIDTDGLNIENNKYLYFNGKRCSLIDNGTQLVYNVPTNNAHSFRTANTERMRISADANGTILTFPTGIIMREYSSFDWFLYEMPFGFTLKYKAGGSDIMEVSNGGLITYEKVSLRNGKKLTWDEGFTNEAYLRKDTINNYLEYDVATNYRHRFSVNGVESAFIDASGVIINSTAVGGAGFPNQLLYLSANKANYIGSSTTDMRYNCSNSGSHNFYQNGTTYLGFWNSLGLYLNPNNSQLQIGTTGVVSIGHDSGGTAMQYRVPTAWVHNFQVGGTGVAQIRSEGFYSFQNNTALRLGATSQLEIKHDTASSQIQYKAVGAYSHMFYINNTDLFYEMRSDTFRALRGYQNKLGATGAYVGNNFNFSWSNPVASQLSVWIDTTRLGSMSIFSDYRIKEKIVPARPVLERLCRIKMIEYEFKDIGIFKKCGLSHGFIAHEVQEMFPELNNIIYGEKDEMTDDGLIQPQSVAGEFTNLYLSAIQELNAKIEAQQKQIDGLLVALAKIVSQQNV